MPDGTQDVIRVEGVSKAYGPTRALDRVSLCVHKGEFVALLGLNGAGKSTLFQLLTGLFVADGGRIEVTGHDMARDSVGALASLGIVFQQPTLDLELTVAGNLMFHARLHGQSTALAKRRISDVAAALGFSDQLETKTANLSGGMRRRVELGRAILHEPSILLMDEPTVGLDPASRVELLKLVHQLQAHQSVAVLWATHLCDEVADADRIVVLDRGQVCCDATPSVLMAQTGQANIESAFLSLVKTRVTA